MFQTGTHSDLPLRRRPGVDAGFNEPIMGHLQPSTNLHRKRRACTAKCTGLIVVCLIIAVIVWSARFVIIGNTSSREDLSSQFQAQLAKLRRDFEQQLDSAKHEVADTVAVRDQMHKDVISISESLSTAINRFDEKFLDFDQRLVTLMQDVNQMKNQAETASSEFDSKTTKWHKHLAELEDDLDDLHVNVTEVAKQARVGVQAFGQVVDFTSHMHLY